MFNKLDKVDHWWNYNGRWYQFWYPSAGPIGGMLCGLIATAVIMLCIDYI